MIALAWGLVLPLLSAFAYRRGGRGWGIAIALAVAALALTIAAEVVFGLLYDYVLTIEAGLCGDTPWEASAAALAAYVVVASWAAVKPARLWAWPAAVGSGLAVLLLVEYAFPGAHHYCET
jgi:hypothetical protein